MDNCKNQSGNDLLKLPSLTTLVFFIIVFIFLYAHLPTLLSDNSLSGICGVNQWTISIVIISVLFRSYFTFPHRFITKGKMKSLREINPELVDWAEEKSRILKINPCPVFLYTEHKKISIQAFGTFRHRFIVMNKKELSAAEQKNAFQELKTMVLHELAHFKNGDHWKYQIAKYMIFVVFITLSIRKSLAFLGTAYGVERFRMADDLGMPLTRSNLLIETLGFTFLMGIFILAVNLLGEIREYYADAKAAQIVGQSAILEAILRSSEFWPSSANSEKSFSHRLAMIKKIFGVHQKHYYRERLAVLQEPEIRLMMILRRVIYTAGLAVGYLVFSLATVPQKMGFIIICLVTWILSIAFYLLPYFNFSDKRLRIIPKWYFCSLVICLGTNDHDPS